MFPIIKNGITRKNNRAHGKNQRDLRHVQNQNNVKQRDQARRILHNEVEQRRRNKINFWIQELGRIVPPDNSLEFSGAREGKSCFDIEVRLPWASSIVLNRAPKQTGRRLFGMDAEVG